MFADTILGMGRESVFESAVDPEIEAISVDTVEECVGDPFEFAAGVVYEAQMDMMKINQAIMCCEYAYLKETGEEMVYEANVFTNLWAGIKKTAKKVWAKICQFFKKIFRWLDNTVTSDKQWVKKYEEKLKNMKGSSVTIDYEGYEYFAEIGGEVSPKFDKIFDPMIDGATELAKIAGDYTLDTEKDKVVGMKKVNEKAVTKKLNEIRAKVVGETWNGKDSNVDDFTEKVKKYLRGDKKTYSTISKDKLGTYLGIVRDGKITRRSLDVNYTLAKNLIDNIVKAATAAEKTINDILKRKDSTANQNASKSAHEIATGLNTLTSMCASVNSQCVNALTAQNRQCKAIVSAALGKVHDADKKKKSSNESAVDQIFEAFGL